MRRRQFILGVAAVATDPAGASRVALGQQRDKLRRIGVITGGSPYARSTHPYLDGLPDGMRELGYVEGKDFILEWRFADVRYERFPELAAELVDTKVEVIVLTTAAAIRPVQQVTGIPPIVMGYSTDPVGAGLVASLARPGGNITGLASLSDETAPKQLQLLRRLIPNVLRVGLLQNPNNSSSAPDRRATQAAARESAITVVPVEALQAAQIEDAFSTFAQQGVQAVKLTPDALFMVNRRRIAELALARGLPSIFPHREYTEAGGLMSYGESLKDFFHRAARYVDKILKGATPSDLPIEQPTRFDLVINRKTAWALDLSIPPDLYALTDEFVE
jgi:putative tryptophan/tyrosine transport system substrate-binding protein